MQTHGHVHVCKRQGESWPLSELRVDTRRQSGTYVILPTRKISSNVSKGKSNDKCERGERPGFGSKRKRRAIRRGGGVPAELTHLRRGEGRGKQKNGQASNGAGTGAGAL